MHCSCAVAAAVAEDWKHETRRRKDYFVIQEDCAGVVKGVGVHISKCLQWYFELHYSHLGDWCTEVQ